MTTQTSKNIGRRRAATGVLAGGALAVGVMFGGGAPAAWADPADSSGTTTDAAPATPEMTADQALAIIGSEYDTGAGGGQLSNLIHQVLKLRGQGFLPSKGNRMAITAALDKRPNQAPLIAALQETIAFQSRAQQRAAAQQQPAANNPGTGLTPYNPGVVPDPNGAPSINIPLG
jgi:hypothetical protein